MDCVGDSDMDRTITGEGNEYTRARGDEEMKWWIIAFIAAILSGPVADPRPLWNDPRPSIDETVTTYTPAIR